MTIVQEDMALTRNEMSSGGFHYLGRLLRTKDSNPEQVTGWTKAAA
jgi:hypothetical protein